MYLCKNKTKTHNIFFNILYIKILKIKEKVGLKTGKATPVSKVKIIKRIQIAYKSLIITSIFLLGTSPYGLNIVEMFALFIKIVKISKFTIRMRLAGINERILSPSMRNLVCFFNFYRQNNKLSLKC